MVRLHNHNCVELFLLSILKLWVRFHELRMLTGHRCRCFHHYYYFNFFICFLRRQLDNVSGGPANAWVVNLFNQDKPCQAMQTNSNGMTECRRNKNKSLTTFRRCFTLTMFVSQLLAGLSTSPFCLHPIWKNIVKKKTRIINIKHTIGDGSSLTRTYCVTAISFATWHEATAQRPSGRMRRGEGARERQCVIFFSLQNFRNRNKIFDVEYSYMHTSWAFCIVCELKLGERERGVCGRGRVQ